MLACNVKWLGLRKDDIEQLVPEESLIPLKPRDYQIAKSLESSEILHVICAQSIQDLLAHSILLFYVFMHHRFLLFCQLFVKGPCVFYTG